MPPAFRNNLGPTASDIPAQSAAASLLNPVAMARQNRSCSPRLATGGRPNDPRRARVDRFFRIVIATSASRLLRRPVESAPGLPCTMVLTACFVLSPVTGLSCHRHSANMVRFKPGWAKCTFTKLDTSVGASRPHDFAVHDLHRSSVRRLIAHGKPPCDHLAHRRCRVHRIPPHVRDDRETPLVSGGMATNKEVIWAKDEAEYFLPQGWTGFAGRECFARRALSIPRTVCKIASSPHGFLRYAGRRCCSPGYRFAHPGYV